MNARDQAMMDAIGRVLVDEIEAATKPLREQIADLQKTLEDFGHVGTWHQGSVYRRGNFVSLGGSMWSCSAEATTERPSTSSRDWMLAVKRGRDGKHGVSIPEPREPRLPTSGRALGS